MFQDPISSLTSESSGSAPEGVARTSKLDGYYANYRRCTLRLHMQLLSRRKHYCVGKGPMELSACSRVSKDRTLGNYSDYSARSSYVEMPKLGHTQRDRRGERDARGKASTVTVTQSTATHEENTSLLKATLCIALIPEM
ncbi:unnamed protein product [Lasius platythorax]|uniref:Uncharacterized protein n=1 Tax=Lasius platythorax TaxID=488582 RepID=A0AAV2NU78_9HYME